MLFQYGSLGDTFYFNFPVNNVDGGAYHPAFQTINVYVRECGAAIGLDPIYTDQLADTDDRLPPGDNVWPDGAWELSIPATAGNGFEAGKTYAVYIESTVGSVSPTGMIGMFKLTTNGAIPGTATASPPGQTTGYATTYDEDGVVETGVVVTCQLISVDRSVTGAIFDSAVRSETSDGAGLVQFTGLFPGATYEFKRRSSSSATASGYRITIPTTHTADTYPLPPIIGTP